jgi:hypothetical protein
MSDRKWHLKVLKKTAKILLGEKEKAYDKSPSSSQQKDERNHLRC